jgi:glutamine synthetase
MDELHHTARRFITLYDQALKARGIHVLLGIEQEFCMQRDPGAMERMKGLNSEEKISEQMAARAERAFHDAPDRIAGLLKKDIKPGPVERFYRERVLFPKLQSYSKYEITTTPSEPLRAAGRVESFRRFLRSHAQDEAVVGKGKKEWRVRKIEFPAYDDARAMTYGMHINVSLQYLPPGSKKDQAPIPLMGTGLASELQRELVADHIIAGLKKYCASEMLLIADTPAAYDRFHRNNLNFAPHTLSKGFQKRPDPYLKEYRNPAKHRVEFRLPNAGSDPCLSTLMVMAALYDQFHALPVGAARGDNDKTLLDRNFALALEHARHETAGPDELCKTLDEARERFASSDRLASSMKKVATEYGTAADIAAAAEFKAEVLSRSSRLESLANPVTIASSGQERKR